MYFVYSLHPSPPVCVRCLYLYSLGKYYKLILPFPYLCVCVFFFGCLCVQEATNILRYFWAHTEVSLYLCICSFILCIMNLLRRVDLNANFKPFLFPIVFRQNAVRCICFAFSLDWIGLDWRVSKCSVFNLAYRSIEQTLVWHFNASVLCIFNAFSVYIFCHSICLYFHGNFWSNFIDAVQSFRSQIKLQRKKKHTNINYLWCMQWMFVWMYAWGKNKKRHK